MLDEPIRKVMDPNKLLASSPDTLVYKAATLMARRIASEAERRPNIRRRAGVS